MRRYARDLSNPRDLTRDVRAALGLVGTKYPTSLSRSATLEDGRRVRLVASRPEALTRTTYRGRRVRSAQHRLQIYCTECHQWIPVGRYSQHAGKRSCGAARTRYEQREQQGQGRSIMQLRRLAFKARSSQAARAVLHDALLEAFPRTYPLYIRKAERASRQKEPMTGQRNARYVTFLARNLRHRRVYNEDMFFSIWHPDWGQYLEPPNVFVYSTTGVVPPMPVLPNK